MIKKPTKPPPPPPPPSRPTRYLSPARSSWSLSCHSNGCNGGIAGGGGGNGSEYAESVCSVPNFFLHQPSSQTSSLIYSCKSESNHSVKSNQIHQTCCPTCHRCDSSASSSYRSVPTCQATPPSCCAQQLPPQCSCQHLNYSPCASNHGGCGGRASMSNHVHSDSFHSSVLATTPLSSSTCHTCTYSSCTSTQSCHGSATKPPLPQLHQQQPLPNLANLQHKQHLCRINPMVDMAKVNKSLPPIPNPRSSRPQQSVSPQPILQKEHPRSRNKCKASHYRRHIEQHMVKVFKYLKEREIRRQERRQECEEGVSGGRKDNAAIFCKIYAEKESNYLRSLRAPISRADYQEIQKLGSGYIGNVTLVKKREPFDGSRNVEPEYYAMKKLRKSQVSRQNHWAHVTAERDILAEANSEWIVKLFSTFQDETHLYFILEYVPGGDMMNLLYKMNVFPEEWASFYIAEISLALQFVHNKGFVHRDIKPDNILIDANGHIKLADFGLCTGFRWTHDSKYYLDDTLTLDHQNENIGYFSGNNNSTINNNNNNFEDITKVLTKREIEHSSKKRHLSLVGSPNYIAPEVLRQGGPGANERLCDWWSVGVILYEMVIGYCPFIDLEPLKTNSYDPALDTPSRTQERILEWKKYLAFPSPNDDNGPPLLPDKNGVKRYISNETKNLIQGLLCDPQDRLCQNGISDIQNHPFFKGTDWNNIRNGEAPFKPELKSKLDTRHFDPEAQQSFPDYMFDSTTNTNKMSFTFKNFWPK